MCVCVFAIIIIGESVPKRAWRLLLECSWECICMKVFYEHRCTCYSLYKRVSFKGFSQVCYCLNVIAAAQTRQLLYSGHLYKVFVTVSCSEEITTIPRAICLQQLKMWSRFAVFDFNLRPWDNQLSFRFGENYDVISSVKLEDGKDVRCSKWSDISILA